MDIVKTDKSLLLDIPEREEDANKYTYGHVLIIAGSEGMSGAAFLSALAAYRSGAGLVSIMSSEKNRVILQTVIPEAIFVPYEEEDIIYEPANFISRLKSGLNRADVIVLGPGLGRGEHVRPLVETVLSEAYVPLIVDADALYAIAKYPELTKYYTDNIIITPHIKEMSLLCGQDTDYIRENACEIASAYSREYGITCVLKSSKTVIAIRDRKIFMNTSGTPALAKAGTGDVLTGIIAGMICLGIEDDKAAVTAVYIHGLAGEAAKDRQGEHGVIARDIIGCIPRIMMNKGL